MKTPEPLDWEAGREYNMQVYQQEKTRRRVLKAASYNERKRFIMATKNVKNRKPLTSGAKGLICLAVLLIVTVFVSCLSLTGMNLDAQGINKLLPWVPVSGANWPDSLPLSRTLNGGTYIDYAYPEDADSAALDASVKTIRARLNQLGESDADVALVDGAIRVSLRKMDASSLASMRNFATLSGKFEFTDPNSSAVLTEKDIEKADVSVDYNSSRTSYTVKLRFTLNKDGQAKLAESNPSYVAVTCDGDTVSSYALVDGGKITATVGYNNDAYNTAANLAFLANYGSVDVTLNRSGDGDVAPSAGGVLNVVLIVFALLLVCALVYMVMIGKLTGVSGFLSVWCAVVIGLFFVATIVVPSSRMLNVGCLVAVLLGALLAIYTAVTRTDAISKQIAEGGAPKSASKLGFRASAKTIWIAHGGALALSLILMIFPFSKSTGYTLAAMVTASAACTVVMRAFQGCFTMMNNKPSLFGKAK